MTILFSELTKLYRIADFDKNSGYATCNIPNDEFLSLIKKANKNYDSTRIQIIGDSSNLALDQTVRLEIRQPDTKLGALYFQFRDFIKGDFSRVLSKKLIDNNPYYIKDLDYCSHDSVEPESLNKYNLIKEFIRQLESMSVYSDKTNKKLIFFSKHTFELSYDISNQVDEFIETFENISKEVLKTIEDFCGWIDDDKTSKQKNEKKSILAFVFSSYMEDSDEQLNILSLIHDIEKIYNDTSSQFNLYLEDFKYDKFVKKLEDNSEQFIARINESISKVLSQVLALPIATIAPIIFRGNKSTVPFSSQLIIYLALFSYAIICYFALITQKEVLDNIKVLVNSDKQSKKIPTTLKKQWLEEKTKINLLIEKQRYLYWTMYIVTCSVIFYSSFSFLRTIW